MSAVEGYGLLVVGGGLLLLGITGVLTTAAVRGRAAWQSRTGLWPWAVAAVLGLGILAYFVVPVLLAPG